MKEEDIDKLFRDKLSGSVEPISEGDWNAFEKNLNPKGGYFNFRNIVLAVLLLGGVSVSIYLLNPSIENVDSISEAKEVIQKEANPISEEQVSKSISQIQSEVGATSKNKIEITKDLGNDTKNPSLDVESNTELSESYFSTSDSKLASTEILKNNKLAGSSMVVKSNEIEVENRSAERTSNIGIGGSSPSQFRSAENDQKSSLDNTPSLASKGANLGSADNNSVEKSMSDGISSSGDTPSMAETHLSAELSLMRTLNGQISRDVNTPDLRNLDQTANYTLPKRINPFIYVKGEHNSILQTGIGFGIGLEIPIGKSQNWLRYLSVKAGVGFYRSSELAWEQKTTTTIYGFDRYESESELETTQLNLIQIPISLNYRFGGVHNVFLGVENSFVLRANQNLRVRSAFDDSATLSEGYLYGPNTPDMIYFIQLGYGYNLSERYGIELGGSFSNQTWNTSSETPLGAFLKLNYHIR